MRKHGETHGDDEADVTRAGVSRRTMLVGSGGLLLAVAATVGWTDGGTMT